MLDTIRADSASERPHRTVGAHNTTQAAGAVWCISEPTRQPLGERRHSSSVLEKVFLADGYSILNEKRTILFGKADSAVMFLLPGYITSNHFAVAHTVGKPSILFSPAIKGGEMRVGFQPLACHHFEVLYKLGHCQRGRERNENMYVVGHTADTVQVTTDVVDEAENIGVELALMVNADGVLASMSAENDMIQGLCVTHTNITENSTLYCLTYTLSPVSDRPGTLMVATMHTALHLRLVRCYVRLWARSVSPTLPLEHILT